MTNFNATLTLSSRIMVRTVGGKPIYWDVEQTPVAVLAAILEVGAKTILTNTFNGGGKDATESEKLGAMQKKLDAWARGEFNITERGESGFTVMYGAYQSEMVAKGLTLDAIDKARKARVEAVLGKDAKNTAANFFNALATEIAKAQEADAADVLEFLVGKYLALADEMAKEAAKVSAALDVSAIDMTGFKKKPAKK